MVSVIVPVYNANTYLDKCVNSLIKQTYRDIEILLIDDCSTDGSGLKCDQYAQFDQRIKTVHFLSNKGPSAARNYGISHAQGEWIVFVDADDWLDYRCVEQAVKIASINSADVVIWNLINHTGKKEKYEKALNGDKRIFQRNEICYLQNMLLTLESETGMSVWELTGPVCKLYQMDLVRNILFPENINSGEDVCFVMQVFQAAQTVVYINDFFYHREVIKHSLSHKMDFEFAERRIKCVNWMLDYCYKENIGNTDLWNEFVYKNFKMVVNKYIHLLPTRYHIKSYKKIKWFLNELIEPLKIEKAYEKEPRIKHFLKRGWYYRYKMYLVCHNIKNIIMDKLKIYIDKLAD